MSSWPRALGLPPRSVLAGYTMTRRDAGQTALFEGLFAAAWFGWGQAAPPVWLRGWLGAGSVAAVLIAVAGGLTSARRTASTAAGAGFLLSASALVIVLRRGRARPAAVTAG